MCVCVCVLFAGNMGAMDFSFSMRPKFCPQQIASLPPPTLLMLRWLQIAKSSFSCTQRERWRMRRRRGAYCICTLFAIFIDFGEKQTSFSCMIQMKWRNCLPNAAVHNTSINTCTCNQKRSFCFSLASVAPRDARRLIGNYCLYDWFVCCWLKKNKSETGKVVEVIKIYSFARR